MHNSMRAQALAEGALMASITAILGLAGLYLPFIKIFTDMLWTIPIVIVTARHGLQIGGISLGVAGILIFALSQPLQAVFLILQFGALALFYGIAFQKKLKPTVTLLVGTVIAVISLLLVIALIMGLFGLDAIDFAKQLQASIEPTIQLYDKLGLFNQSGGQTGYTAEYARDLLASFTNAITLVIPALLVIWALSTAILNYLLAQVVLVRLKIEIPVLSPFREWRLPWWIIWGFIMGFAVYLVGDHNGLLLLSQVGANIMMIYVPVLFVLGLSVLSFFIGKYLPSKGARLLILFMAILFFNFVFVAVLSVGIFDLVFNYRRLEK